MAYVTKAYIEPFISKGVDTLFGSSTYFTAIEKMASDMVVKIVGGSVPSNVTSTPTWYYKPIAAICSWLCLPKMNNLSPEEVTKIEREKDWAIEYLAANTKGTDITDPDLYLAASNSGTIDVGVW